MVRIKNKEFIGNVVSTNKENATLVVVLHSAESVSDIADFMTDATEISEVFTNGTERPYRVKDFLSVTTISQFIYSIAFTMELPSDQEASENGEEQSVALDDILVAMLEV